MRFDDLSPWGSWTASDTIRNILSSVCIHETISLRNTTAICCGPAHIHIGRLQKGCNPQSHLDLNGAWRTVRRGEDWHTCHTVYPKKYAHGFVVLCFVVVMQSFIMNSHEVLIHIHQGCFAGTGAIVRLPQCQWSKPDGYGKISQCITTTKHSKAKTVSIFFGIYCSNETWCTVNQYFSIVGAIREQSCRNAHTEQGSFHDNAAPERRVCRTQNQPSTSSPDDLNNSTWCMESMINCMCIWFHHRMILISFVAALMEVMVVILLSDYNWWVGNEIAPCPVEVIASNYEASLVRRPAKRATFKLDCTYNIPYVSLLHKWCIIAVCLIRLISYERYEVWNHRQLILSAWLRACYIRVDSKESIKGPHHYTVMTGIRPWPPR